MAKETNCYSCIHSRSNSDNNSAHIHCRLHWSYNKKNKAEHPKGAEHGIQNGWYDFPYDYDPIWMIEPCKHYTTK